MGSCRDVGRPLPPGVRCRSPKGGAPGTSQPHPPCLVGGGSSGVVSVSVSGLRQVSVSVSRVGSPSPPEPSRATHTDRCPRVSRRFHPFRRWRWSARSFPMYLVTRVLPPVSSVGLPGQRGREEPEPQSDRPTRGLKFNMRHLLAHVSSASWPPGPPHRDRAPFPPQGVPRAGKGSGVRGIGSDAVEPRYKDVVAVAGIDSTSLRASGSGSRAERRRKDHHPQDVDGLLHPTSGTCRVAGYVPRERGPEFLRAITLVMARSSSCCGNCRPPTRSS